MRRSPPPHTNFSINSFCAEKRVCKIFLLGEYSKLEDKKQCFFLNKWKFVWGTSNLWGKTSVGGTCGGTSVHRYKLNCFWKFYACNSTFMSSKILYEIKRQFHWKMETLVRKTYRRTMGVKSPLRRLIYSKKSDVKYGYRSQWVEFGEESSVS